MVLRRAAKKGSIRVGQFADLAVLDIDFLRWMMKRSNLLSPSLPLLTERWYTPKDDFRFTRPPTIPVLPDWSPVKNYPVTIKMLVVAKASAAETAAAAGIHSCKGSCNVYGHHHDIARKSNIPVNNYTRILGCIWLLLFCILTRIL